MRAINDNIRTEMRDLTLISRQKLSILSIYIDRMRPVFTDSVDNILLKSIDRLRAP